MGVKRALDRRPLPADALAAFHTVAPQMTAHPGLGGAAMGKGPAGPGDLAQKNGSRRRCAPGVWCVCLVESASELLICSPA
jgi:hypothetical protein